MVVPPFDRRPGPLARAAAELEHHRRISAFRRERELRSRRLLRESDLLLDLVEECRLRRLVPVPPQLWMHVVRFVGALDDNLRDELGINRHPDHIGEVLFAAQDQLLRRHRDDRERPARIIPLFPRLATTPAGGA